MSMVKLSNKGSNELPVKEYSKRGVSTLFYTGYQCLNKLLYLISLNLSSLTCKMEIHLPSIITETTSSQGLAHSKYSMHSCKFELTA